jgi:hypothetical protein
MMNSLVKIGLAVLLPAVAVVAVLLANNRPDQLDPRQREMQTYLHCRSAAYSPTLQIGESVQARLPQNFQADMSKASFSNTPYYETDCRFNPDYAGYKPMPFPPNDLWCVKVISADPKVPQAIVVALHRTSTTPIGVHEVTDPEIVLSTLSRQFSIRSNYAYTDQ